MRIVHRGTPAATRVVGTVSASKRGATRIFEVTHYARVTPAQAWAALEDPRALFAAAAAGHPPELLTPPPFLKVGTRFQVETRLGGVVNGEVTAIDPERRMQLVAQTDPSRTGIVFSTQVTASIATAPGGCHLTWRQEYEGLEVAVAQSLSIRAREPREVEAFGEAWRKRAEGK